MRRLLAGLLLTAAAGYASLHLLAAEYASFRETAASKASRADEITAYVSRFERLKAMLPPDAVVGYVNKAAEGHPLFHYAAAQYALAPVLLDSTGHRELVVVNFPASDAGQTKRLAEAESLTVVADLGNGVVLFRRRDGL